MVLEQLLSILNHKTSGTFNRILDTGSKTTRREQEEGRVLSAFCSSIYNWNFCIHWCSNNLFWFLFFSCQEKLKIIFFHFTFIIKMGEVGKVVSRNMKFKVFTKLIAFASFSFMGQSYLQIHFMEKILNVFQHVQAGDCAGDHRADCWQSRCPQPDSLSSQPWIPLGNELLFVLEIKAMRFCPAQHQDELFVIW